MNAALLLCAYSLLLLSCKYCIKLGRINPSKLGSPTPPLLRCLAVRARGAETWPGGRADGRPGRCR